MAEKNIYRKEALAKLAKPEMLDKSLTVTKPMYWVAVIGAIIVLTAAIVWGFFGHVNINLDIVGVTYTPGYANEYVCDDTGVLTSIYKEQGKFIKAGETIYEYKDTYNSPITKTWQSPVTGLISAIEVYPGAELYPGKKAITIKSFVKEDGNKSTIVSEQENYDPNDSYSNYSKIVYGFIPINNLSQVIPGQEVEVWPLSADKYSHGHMIGKVVHVNAFIASDADINSIIGLNTDISMLEDLGSIGICEIILEPDPNTTSGFYWTSPNGATQAIYEGDVVNASIILGRTRPISLLFPGL